MGSVKAPYFFYFFLNLTQFGEANPKSTKFGESNPPFSTKFGENNPDY